MKDLIITFQNENGEKVKREYERVFDFTEEIEGGRIRCTYAGL